MATPRRRAGASRREGPRTKPGDDTNGNASAGGAKRPAREPAASQDPGPLAEPPPPPAPAAEASTTPDDLPPLTGSEKQVAWAKRLRAGVVAELRAATPAGLTPADVARCLAALRGRVDARFFIDARDGLVAALLASGEPAPASRGAPEKKGPALPPLSGTEKQAAWASRIRAGFLAGLPPDRAEGFTRAARGETRASWWIENRDRLEPALAEAATGGKPKPRLPKLTGSDKQTSWAERIRAAFVDTLTEAELRAWRPTLGKLKDATFWIDRKDDLRAGVQSELDDPGNTARRRAERYASGWE